MSEPQAVTVNVNAGGGRRQRGPGLFSNLGRAPWYVQLGLLIVIGYFVLIVGFQILDAIYDFQVPSPVDFFQDPAGAGASAGAALSAFVGGAWSSTGGRLNNRLKDTAIYRFAEYLPGVKIAQWLFGVKRT